MKKSPHESTTCTDLMPCAPRQPQCTQPLDIFGLFVSSRSFNPARRQPIHLVRLLPLIEVRVWGRNLLHNLGVLLLVVLFVLVHVREAVLLAGQALDRRRPNLVALRTGLELSTIDIDASRGGEGRGADGEQAKDLDNLENLHFC